jgi:hypothetical protein
VLLRPRREQIELLFRCTDQEAPGVVEIERSYCCAAGGGSADNATIRSPFEMIVPVVETGIEEGHIAARLRVGSNDTIRFTQVTARTGESEVIVAVGSADRSWRDVLDAKSSSLKRLVHAAVFASILGAVQHFPDRFRARPTHWGDRPRSRIAWARIKEIDSLSSATASNSSRSSEDS